MPARSVSVRAGKRTARVRCSSRSLVTLADRTPARPEDESPGSTRLLNATPDGSLAFAQGSTGWERGALLAMARHRHDRLDLDAIGVAAAVRGEVGDEPGKGVRPHGDLLVAFLALGGVGGLLGRTGALAADRQHHVEGAVAEVARVSFVGNKDFSDYRLRQILTTKQAGILHNLIQRDMFQIDRLEADKKMLTDFYLSRGYLDFQILDAGAT